MGKTFSDYGKDSAKKKELNLYEFLEEFRLPKWHWCFWALLLAIGIILR